MSARHVACTDVVIIGAGQAGLALSHQLSHRGVDHVVLERGRVAERWRSERWDSMQMLTPNWMNSLPGSSHGSDPDGYLHASDFADYLERYASHLLGAGGQRRGGRRGHVRRDALRGVDLRRRLVRRERRHRDGLVRPAVDPGVRSLVAAPRDATRGA